jgi:hypothetical protein
MPRAVPGEESQNLPKTHFCSQLHGRGAGSVWPHGVPAFDEQELGEADIVVRNSQMERRVAMVVTGQRKIQVEASLYQHILCVNNAASLKLRLRGEEDG